MTVNEWSIVTGSFDNTCRQWVFASPPKSLAPPRADGNNPPEIRTQFLTFRNYTARQAQAANLVLNLAQQPMEVDQM